MQGDLAPPSHRPDYSGYRDLNTQHHELAMEIKKNRLEYARKGQMFRNEQEFHNEGEKVRINKRDKDGGLPQICYDSDHQDMEYHENLSSTPGPHDHDNAIIHFIITTTYWTVSVHLAHHTQVINHNVKLDTFQNHWRGKLRLSNQDCLFSPYSIRRL